ncbi:MAG: hypothetical protein J7M38_02790, partial [Armatimonadetes bacterium]|nr:hypothetical protein [Armatimonadota bacterium]
PNEGLVGGAGLWLPLRGSVDQTAMNLDADWGGQRGLTLLCEAVDPHQPIGLRITARCEDWTMGYGNLALEIGPSPYDTHPICTQNRRFGSGLHRWYIETDMREIYGRDTDRARFAIVLRAEGRGAWLISRMQIFHHRVR